ncbi:hypothetical protein [Nonomuraea sp. NPDC050786]|uniref:hypothetical protein n=1 Tax=Nonomuraea sp. NPDC050786 TaxID=3154840 RepID=UPI0033F40969
MSDGESGRRHPAVGMLRGRLEDGDRVGVRADSMVELPSKLTVYVCSPAVVGVSEKLKDPSAAGINFTRPVEVTVPSGLTTLRETVVIVRGKVMPSAPKAPLKSGCHRNTAETGRALDH